MVLCKLCGPSLAQVSGILAVPRVLITGSNGFVGRATVTAFLRAGFVVRAGVRSMTCAYGGAWSEPGIARLLETAAHGDIGPTTDWSSVLQGVDSVVHLAARVHVMRDRATDPLSEFRRTNVAGTLNLANQAVACGIKRFVFVSSIKVNGECTVPGHPFTPDDQPEPTDPYGISKLEAEVGLRELERHTNLDAVIVRPVLVYGPGVKANFRTMMRALAAGIPLPFGGLGNRRSFVGLRNLADFLVTAVRLEAAAHQTFLVSDGEDLSTTELLRRLAALLGRPARLANVPALLLERIAWFLRQEDLARRICGTLQVDSSKTVTRLGWVPPFRVDDELQSTVESFLAGARGDRL
jgi:nucleoside-diphosphate-sugar epimerase